MPFCGSGAFDPAKPMVTICTTHAAYHELFGTTPQFQIPYPPDDAPAIGAISVKRVRATSIFDGWGYLSLFRRERGKVERVDSYAIPEALDPDFAFGFGDLSIHEIATDPGQNIAYSSYYAGGMRVFGFGASGIEELGHYIDPEGNNFWGVETFVPASSAAGNLEGSACSRAPTATTASSSSATRATSPGRRATNERGGGQAAPSRVTEGRTRAGGRYPQSHGPIRRAPLGRPRDRRRRRHGRASERGGPAPARS